MIIYCDGGYKRELVDGMPLHLVSWGIKIIDGDDDVELMGARAVPGIFCGWHETFAFLEAIAYAMTHNGNTLNTTIVTDQINFLDCRSFKSKTPGSSYRLHKSLADSFNKFSAYYSAEVIEMAKQFLIYGKIRWQKGHTHECVYHSRADYLARAARRIYLGAKIQLDTFEAWLYSFTCSHAQHHKNIPAFC